MIQKLAIVLTLALAPAAGAQDLSPEEFEAWTTDRTFGTFFPDGTLLGVEVFLRDRNVIWQTPDGTCHKGIWQVQDGYICYLYEGDNPGHCMTYSPDGDGLVGITDEGEEFHLLRGSSDLVTCPTDPLMSLNADRRAIVLARQGDN